MSVMRSGPVVDSKAQTLPRALTQITDRDDLTFCDRPAAELYRRLGATEQGLSGVDARRRLLQNANDVGHSGSVSRSATLLLAQFRSPIVLILLAATMLAAFLGQPMDALLIVAIVLGSGLLGFWQERGAADAVEALLARVRVKASVLRDGRETEVPLEEVVSGDVTILNAGDVIPGDCLVLESKDLYLSEAALTGETLPAEKAPGLLPADTPLAHRSNCLFQGTHVVSGTAKALVVHTGSETEFGRLARHMRSPRPETQFERGVRRFGYLLMEVTLLLVIAIFAVNVALARPVLDSFLFSLALAVGLTPQLLPAIVSVNLAHGARRMAGRGVIVKRLASIEDFGSMDVLCSDKTGTLTEGVVRLESAVDFEGQPSEKARLCAFLNAQFESGFTNPIDEAIRAVPPCDVAGYRKLDEVPYDFLRKRLSILVEKEGRPLLVTKGAVSAVLDVCSHAETAGGEVVPLPQIQEIIEGRYQELGNQGFRTLGVAYREPGAVTTLAREHEANLTFVGFVVLHDPPRDRIAETVQQLARLGVALKIVTGDNRHVAEALGRQVGIDRPGVLTGAELRLMSDEALVHRVGNVGIFAEVEPNQKERILLAIKKAGDVVGYIGDGINDASALHAADVGISVDSAVDVAKQAADIVLLGKGLDVLTDGVREGRVTFANTLKYVSIATSANFGNMFSMAGVSLLIPFLPLLPKQILLLNMLTDLPEMAIAYDRVDDELVERPHRWDIGAIRKFMVVFGAVSSLFDYATFGLLLWVLHASTVEFRTGWFVESVVSACAVVMVIRTRAPFFASRPGRALLAGTVLVIGVALALPYSPVAAMLGFGRLPVRFLLALTAVVACYVALAETVKRLYFRPGSAGRRADSRPSVLARGSTPIS